jgi:hypothetical protein
LPEGARIVVPSNAWLQSRTDAASQGKGVLKLISVRRPPKIGNVRYVYFYPLGGL